MEEDVSDLKKKNEKYYERKKTECQDDNSLEEIEEDVSDQKTTIVKIMTLNRNQTLPLKRWRSMCVIKKEIIVKIMTRKKNLNA